VFGSVLRKAREKRGMTLIALAREIGVTESAVARWEKGERFPRGDNLYRLETALGVKHGFFGRACQWQ